MYNDHEQQHETPASPASRTHSARSRRKIPPHTKSLLRQQPLQRRTGDHPPRRSRDQTTNPDATFLLGVAYGETLYWYETAAKLGDKDAMLATGWLYYKGEATKQDLEKAKMWFQKAAELGDQDAAEMVRFIEGME